MPQASTAADFWSWFTSNQSRFRNVTHDKEPLLDELLERLHAYCEDLYFAIGGAPDGPLELVITAEGVAEAFDAVRALVGAAPRIEGWTFIAFKPPAGFEFVTQYESARIDAERSWFMPLESSANPAQFGMRLACDDYVAEQHDDFLAGAHIVVETGLGELAAAEQVHFIDVERTPKSPAEHGYIELPALAAYLEWRRTKAKQ